MKRLKQSPVAWALAALLWLTALVPELPAIPTERSPVFYDCGIGYCLLYDGAGNYIAGYGSVNPVVRTGFATTGHYIPEQAFYFRTDLGCAITHTAGTWSSTCRGTAGSGTTNTITKWTGASTLGDTTTIQNPAAGEIRIHGTSTIFRDAATTGVRNGFWNLNNTFPSSPGGILHAMDLRASGAGSDANDRIGLFFLLEGTYSGAGLTAAVLGQNTLPSSGVAYGGNFVSDGTGANTVGLLARAGNAATTTAVGMVGHSTAGTNQFGGAFGLGAAPTVGTTSTALIADNLAVAADIFCARDNGTNMLCVGDGGDVRVNRTVTAGGTTGAQTINKAAGTVNFAAVTSSLVVTNSLVTANSIIDVVARTNDATCTVKNYVPAAGSFTINMTANCTAETSVGFVVTN